LETINTELFNKVKNTFVEALKVEPAQVTPELQFGDLPQWDSMGHMELLMMLEEDFGVAVNAETIAQLVSIPLICAYIQEGGNA
jgi:acyl carrier protein